MAKPLHRGDWANGGRAWSCLYGFQVACHSRVVMDIWRSRFYSELNLNQYSVGSPCRNVCTVCGSPPCPDLNLIHYSYCSYIKIFPVSQHTFQVASISPPNTISCSKPPANSATKPGAAARPAGTPASPSPSATASASALPAAATTAGAKATARAPPTATATSAAAAAAPNSSAAPTPPSTAPGWKAAASA